MELYHLSHKENLNILIPKIPETAVFEYEDTVTPRVCFSNSIDNCLASLASIGKYYVYVAKNIDNTCLYKPSKDKVMDVDITHELWALNPINVVCIGVIMCEGIRQLRPFKIDRDPYTIYYREYYWKWLEKYY